jgi:hypothetical protein
MLIGLSFERDSRSSPEDRNPALISVNCFAECLFVAGRGLTSLAVADALFYPG